MVQQPTSPSSLQPAQKAKRIKRRGSRYTNLFNHLLICICMSFCAYKNSFFFLHISFLLIFLLLLLLYSSFFSFNNNNTACNQIHSNLTYILCVVVIIILFFGLTFILCISEWVSEWVCIPERRWVHGIVSITPHYQRIPQVLTSHAYINDSFICML